MDEIRKANLKAFVTEVYLIMTPDKMNAIISEKAKQRLFSNMLPGKYFIKNVIMKKLNELQAQRKMLPTRLRLSVLSFHISR